jgi:signal transduction histidine kinase
MGPLILSLLAIASLGLVPLLLAKGFRLDRALFAIYVAMMASAAFAALIWPEHRSLHWKLDLMACGLPVINTFMCLEERLLEGEGSLGRLSRMLLPFSWAGALAFVLGSSPEITNGDFFLPQSRLAPLLLVFFVGSMASMSMCWDRWVRTPQAGTWEGLFRLGLVLWWLIFLFLLARALFSGERTPIFALDVFLGVNLAWLAGAYPLVLRRGFLDVRARPTAHLVGKATQTVAVMAIVGLFLWGEALALAHGMSRTVLEITVIVLLLAVMALPLLPIGPLASLRRYLHQHLYLPERDFAQEVALYVKVMAGKEDLRAILGHLCEVVGAKAAFLYRPDRLGGMTLEAFWGEAEDLPQRIEGEFFERASLSPKRSLRKLLVEEELVGVLVLEELPQRLGWDKESLLRFWSSTLGILLRELEWREREEDRKKLASYSEATSFLLHDAKNLAQLLDLILKNYSKLDPSEKESFLEMALPGLEQAQERARRLLEKLETFHPTDIPVKERIDLVPFLKEWAEGARSAFPQLDLTLRIEAQEAEWRGDAKILSKALDNLFSNAAQATEGRGPVEVVLTREGKAPLIEIRDWGPGVEEKDRKRLFEPLFTRKKGGMGLGLYQARVLVERLGGKVGFRENSPRGSVFYVRLDENPDSGG